MRISGNRLTQTYNKTYSRPISSEVISSQLEFKPLKLSDIPLLRKYMEYNSDRTCDYTLGGMFMWIDYFGYEYAIVNDTLFIKGISENHPEMVAFSLPLGKLPLKDTVTMIKEYCRSNGLRPAFSAIPEEKAHEIADLCGGHIEILEGWSDYLYDASSLATLTGKAYSKKRNHVNRFLNDNPDAKLEMLTADNIEEARAFLEKVNLSEKEDQDTASYELSQCKEVLDNLNLYLFDGAILRDQQGKICALTLGEVVGDTLYVHIEKMDHEVAGAGETVNKLFAGEMLNRYSGINYINREEDMNDAGLRFAKESYHPCALLHKCNVIV